jgi:group I intron endonuclease
VDFDVRIDRHKRELKLGKHHSIKLQEDYDECNDIHAFEFIIYYSTYSLQDAIDMEQDLLDNHECYYNISRHSVCGDLISMHPNRDAIVKKISDASRRHVANLSDDDRLELSLKSKGSNNPMYGKRGKDHPAYGNKLTEEHKLKLRLAASGRIVSQETRDKLSAHAKGKPAWNKGLKMKPMSDEQKKLVSLAHLGKPNYAVRKKCSCDGIIFDSLTEASEYFGLSRTAIRNKILSSSEKFKNYYYL